MKRNKLVIRQIYTASYELFRFLFHYIFIELKCNYRQPIKSKNLYVHTSWI